LKAVNEAADYTWRQQAGSVEIIGKWMALNPTQAAKAYDSRKGHFFAQWNSFG
jgi:hypothetical protein